MDVNNTKRNIKNAAKTGGKYALKGVKFAGKTMLTATEFSAKAATNVLNSNKARRILAKAGTIASTVAFIGPAISITAMNYLFQNCVLGKDVSPVTALKSTFGFSEKVMKEVLDVISVPTAAITNEIGKVANKGKQALDR